MAGNLCSRTARNCLNPNPLSNLIQHCLSSSCCFIPATVKRFVFSKFFTKNRDYEKQPGTKCEKFSTC